MKRIHLLRYGILIILLGTIISYVILSNIHYRAADTLDPNTGLPTTYISPSLKPVDLSGTWLFFPGDNPEHSHATVDDADWETIQVPGLWNFHGYTHSGASWFRRYFSFPEPPDQAQELGLVVPKVIAAYEVYINGHLIGKLGEINFDGSLAREETHIAVFDIPAEYLNFHGLNSIAFRVSSLSADGGFMETSFSIGERSLVHIQFQNYLLRYAAVAAVLLFVGLYHFLVFSVDRTHPHNIYFGLFSTLAGLFVLGQKSLGYWLIPDPWINLIFFIYLPLTLTPFIMIHMVHAFFRKPQPRVVVIVRNLYLLCIVFLLPIPFSETAYRFFFEVVALVVYGSLLLVLGYVITIAISAIDSHLQGARAIALGISMFGITAILNVLANLGIYLPDDLMAEGLLILSICMAVGAAQDVAHTHREMDRMNKSLEHRNQSLHRFVPLQFFTLLKKNDILEINPGDNINVAMSVLFSDIRNFTTISENLSSSDTFAFLNDYLDKALPSIEQNNGFVDKYIGDAIMALFHNEGQNSSAYYAVATAIALQQASRSSLEYFASQYQAECQIGIGINTGDLMLGTIGNSARIDTTVIGQTVNIASRLEGLTRIYKSGIIISESTFSDLQPGTFQTRVLDRVIVKGAIQPINIYEVCDIFPEEQQELRIITEQTYMEGVTLFRDHAFSEAAECFLSVLEKNPRDSAAERYLSRCQEYIINPPEANDCLAIRFTAK